MPIAAIYGGRLMCEVPKQAAIKYHLYDTVKSVCQIGRSGAHALILTQPAIGTEQLDCFSMFFFAGIVY